MGFRCMHGGLAHNSCLGDAFIFFSDDGQRLQFIKPESEWAGEVSNRLLTTPFAAKVS